MQCTKGITGMIGDRGAVTTEGLQEYLSCGRKAAVEVGTQAKARIEIGRRVLWNMEKIRAYLNSISA